MEGRKEVDKDELECWRALHPNVEWKNYDDSFSYRFISRYADALAGFIYKLTGKKDFASDFAALFGLSILLVPPMAFVLLLLIWALA